MSRIVFASDFHLGMQGVASSAEREKALVAWIYQVAMQADEVFFLGDLFDFWFEYQHVVPNAPFRKVLSAFRAHWQHSAIRVNQYICLLAIMICGCLIILKKN